MNQSAEALLKRYRDAYGIARSTVILGGIIKRVGAYFGIVVVAFTVWRVYRVISNGYFDITEVFVCVFGLVLAGFIFASGVIIAAQGQIMLAMLDTAVNTSPNADPIEKATIMNLR
jgi:hypothetical protein